MPYREIADRLGYPSENAANKAVLVLLHRTETEAVTDLRALEAERLDQLTRLTIEGITASTSSPQGLSAPLLSVAVQISERRGRVKWYPSQVPSHGAPGVERGAPLVPRSNRACCGRARSERGRRRDDDRAIVPGCSGR